LNTFAYGKSEVLFRIYTKPIASYQPSSFNDVVELKRAGPSSMILNIPIGRRASTHFNIHETNIPQMFLEKHLNFSLALVAHLDQHLAVRRGALLTFGSTFPIFSCTNGSGRTY
jgi:hypothetical protein